MFYYAIKAARQNNTVEYTHTHRRADTHAPSDLLLDVVRLTNVLTYLHTNASTKKQKKKQN